MEKIITKKDFVISPDKVNQRNLDSDEYYLVLLSKEDYDEVLKSLVCLYKQRLRGRKAYENKGEKTKDKSHEARLIPILDKFPQDKAKIILAKTTEQTKNHPNTKIIIDEIAKGIDKLTREKIREEKKALEAKKKACNISESEESEEEVEEKKTKTNKLKIATKRQM